MKITEIGYVNMSLLLSIVLTKSKQYYDTRTANKLLILAMTFYKFDLNRKRVYLHLACVHHKIWQEIGFWKCSIVLSIFEEVF